MKKIVFLFMFCILFSYCNVYAAKCSNSKLVNLQKVANNIKVDYEALKTEKKVVYNYEAMERVPDDDYKEIGLNFSKIALENNITVQTCFEKENLVEYGFLRGECISHELAFKLTGKTYKSWSARKEKLCNCVEMVDIGVYNSCSHFCCYCYANFDEKLVKSNMSNHNPNSSLLIGELESDDIIKERIN